MPNGVPSSSFREYLTVVSFHFLSESTYVLNWASSYLFPIEALESSTFVDNPWRRSTLVRLATSGLNSGFADKGTSRTLIGAIAGGNERTYPKASDSAIPNQCSGNKQLAPQSPPLSRILARRGCT